MPSPAPYLDHLDQALFNELAKQPPLADASIEEFRAIFEKVQAHKPTSAVTRTSFTVQFKYGLKAYVFKS